MEQVKWLDSKKKGEWISIAILEILSHEIPPGEFQKFLDDTGYSNTGTFDVKLTINGREFPATEFFNKLENKLNEMIHAKAEDIVKERFAKLFNKLSDVESRVDDIFSDMKTEVGW